MYFCVPLSLSGASTSLCFSSERQMQQLHWESFHWE